jgi:fructose-1,6-bisphosphatase
MRYGRTTLSKFIIEEQRKLECGSELIALVNDIQTACKYIASAVAKGALTGTRGGTVGVNVHGEEQKPLDAISNEIMLRSCEWGGYLAGMASEEMEEPYAIPDQYPRGRYLLAFDPLDGSSNLDVNVTVGTIFSVLRAPHGVEVPTVEDFLQPGTAQVCAGYALYGPSAMIVLTLGTGVHGFTLDPEIGAYILTHPDLQQPLLGTAGQALRRGMHRRSRGCPRQGLQHALDRLARRRGSPHPDARRPLHVSARHQGSRETGPPAPAVRGESGELAGRAGRRRGVDGPRPHPRSAAHVILGSRNEVARLERYHEEYDRGEDQPFSSPLFKERSLFQGAA